MKRFKIEHVVCGLTVMITSGCVGHREARQVSKEMIRSSEQATRVTTALKAAAQAELKAHQEARRAVTNLYEAWLKQRQATALAEIKAEFLRVSNRIGADLAIAQMEVVSARARQMEGIKGTLTEKVAPLKASAQRLLKTAKEAAENASRAPGDLRELTNSAATERAYLAEMAEKFEIERNGYEDAVSGLNATEDECLKALSGLARAHQKDVAVVYERGRQHVLTNTPKRLLEIGPEPITNTNAFDDLAAYTTAMSKAGEALQEYFVFNSFGKGSLFETLASSFKDGFIRALPVIGDGKSVSFSEAGDSGKDLLGAIEMEIRGQLKEEEVTAKAALDAMAKDAKERLGNSVKAKLDSAINKMAQENVKP